MRRSLLAVLLTVAACLVVGAAALATGPGGWKHLGTTGGPALNGHVTAMNADTKGALYLGGSFTNAGGIAAADRIASGVAGPGVHSAPRRLATDRSSQSRPTPARSMRAATSSTPAARRPPTTSRSSTAATGARSVRTAPEAGRGSARPRRWQSSAGSSMRAARSPAPAETKRTTSPRRGRSGSPMPRSASSPVHKSATTSTAPQLPARRRRCRSQGAPVSTSRS